MNVATNSKHTIIGFHPNMAQGQDFLLCIYLMPYYNTAGLPTMKFTAKSKVTMVYNQEQKITIEGSNDSHIYNTWAFWVGANPYNYQAGIYLLIHGRSGTDMPWCVQFSCRWTYDETRYRIQEGVFNSSQTSSWGSGSGYAVAADSARELDIFRTLPCVTSDPGSWRQLLVQILAGQQPNLTYVVARGSKSFCVATEATLLAIYKKTVVKTMPEKTATVPGRGKPEARMGEQTGIGFAYISDVISLEPSARMDSIITFR
ncbi:hypothetical protein CHU98_g6469 [Xylaria longipes]|nr:hypothetical protein CHU98_g6469 [Xylaria longipes]